MNDDCSPAGSTWIDVEAPKVGKGVHLPCEPAEVGDWWMRFLLWRRTPIPSFFFANINTCSSISLTIKHQRHTWKQSYLSLDSAKILSPAAEVQQLYVGDVGTLGNGNRCKAKPTRPALQASVGWYLPIHQFAAWGFRGTLLTRQAGEVFLWMHQGDRSAGRLQFLELFLSEKNICRKYEVGSIPFEQLCFFFNGDHFSHSFMMGHSMSYWIPASSESDIVLGAVSSTTWKSSS